MTYFSLFFSNYNGWLIDALSPERLKMIVTACKAEHLKRPAQYLIYMSADVVDQQDVSI